MKKIALTAATALFMASVPASVSFAGPIADAMSCHASCSSSHAQCLTDGLDYSLISDVSEAGDRMSSNLSVRQECMSASAQCHSDCN